jgi:hypothetical protein
MGYRSKAGRHCIGACGRAGLVLVGSLVTTDHKDPFGPPPAEQRGDEWLFAVSGSLGSGPSLDPRVSRPV